MDDQTRIETYEQAEAFIMDALPMFQKVGKKAIGSYTLEKVGDFLQYLGNPHHLLKCIHVAGTNGKGSVSHMLAAVYQQNGYKTGLFTSPHILTYRERMKINGHYIPKRVILNWVQNHYYYLKEKPLSFFEMSLGLACSWFAEEEIDIAIVETGLGGRLDATNALWPIMSIITNIDMDHQDILGDTIELIAMEKAGIIKPYIPVVLGNIEDSIIGIFEKKAQENNAPLRLSDEEMINRYGVEDDRIRYTLRSDAFPSSAITLPTLAPYQKYNLNTVLQALIYLKDCKSLELNPSETKKGLENFVAITQFRGRYEIIHRNPLVIADAAHNPGGIRFFKSLFENKNVHLHLVIGLVAGKDLSQTLSLFPVDATYYFCAAKIPRAMDARQLQLEAGKHGLKGKVWASPRQAVDDIIEHASQDDIGLVIGSIYLLEEIL